ncbi:hypothetical protein [Arthrobacter sp. U41]|uniref:hypothetical protein n=1 Tax=Arthrobacter sp. U41 TaxID=1849032 RepID=UPI000859453F|nr:hypothetical protein [Arthrobacter sp. U41]AOT03280.1 hypothetical protein ASPU41_07955 [Arthrobacter sp. U41]
MFPLTDPSSSEDAHASRADEPRCAEQCGRNNTAFVATNPHLDRWLEVVGGDNELSSEALAAAVVLARTVGLGRVTFTNWQRVNDSLGRHRTDPAVFDTIRELQVAGYVGRFQGNRYNKSRGWSLTIPEGEL